MTNLRLHDGMLVLDAEQIASEATCYCTGLVDPTGPATRCRPTLAKKESELNYICSRSEPEGTTMSDTDVMRALAEAKSRKTARADGLVAEHWLSAKQADTRLAARG